MKTKGAIVTRINSNIILLCKLYELIGDCMLNGPKILHLLYLHYNFFDNRCG